MIASGGMGDPKDIVPVVNSGGADAVAIADILHYKRARISDIRVAAKNAGIMVRAYELA